MIPSSLKTCAWLENSANYPADELRIRIMKEDANIAKRANETMSNEVTPPNKITTAKKTIKE